MNRANDLISIMAGRYQIERGTTEPVEQWQMRVIYSVLGQMAYASLWRIHTSRSFINKELCCQWKKIVQHPQWFHL